MTSALISLLVLVIIVGICVYVVTLLIDLLPMDARFLQIAKVLLVLIAVLIILARALPLVGLSI